MIQRTGGATLAEIVALPGWQKHTIRGFVSVVTEAGRPDGREHAARKRQSPGIRSALSRWKQRTRGPKGEIMLEALYAISDLARFTDAEILETLRDGDPSPVKSVPPSSARRPSKDEYSELSARLERLATQAGPTTEDPAQQ